MATTIAERLGMVHPRKLRMECPHDHRAHLAHAKAQPLPIAGPALAAAIRYADVTPKQLSAETGKPLTSVYRWLKGEENAPLDRLWALGCRFQHGYILALGRSCEGATVTDTVSFQHARLG